MRYHCVVPLLGAAANILICILVLRQGIRDKLHRAFAWMALAIVSWNLDIFALYYFTELEDAEWWSRIFRTGICVAPPIVFHFALVLSRSEGRIWRGLLFGGYASGVLLAVANLNGQLVERLTPHTWGWYVEPTPLYTGLTVSLVVFLLLSAERVLHTHRHPETPRQRVQAEFWLLASAIQVPSALTNLLPLYGFSTYPLGNIGNVFFVGIVAYAIARHRLMDVDYVVRKGVSFSLASAVVLVPGGVGLGMLTRDLGVEAPLVIVCAAISLALVAVLLIPTLQEAMETRVQRAFFPHLHDYRRRLRELAAMLVHVLDERKLLRRLGDALIDILSLESCHAFVHDEESRRLSLAYPSGDGEALPEDVALALEDLAGPILAPELEATSPLAAAYFRARGWEVGIPLRSNRGLTGFVALGQNKDFRIFSGEDLQLLSTVAAGASVALENASLSNQLRHSEIVLERANRLSSLGMLAAGIAHEIRNPLVAVKTFLDLLPQRLEDREFMSSFRDLSLAELRRVTNLITDLLALGKSTTAERRAVDLSVSVEPVARLMESTARKRGVELRCTLARALPTVWADPDQLKQILLNLVLNAIEVSPNGAMVTLDVRTPRATDTVVLEVRDEGPGIPADQLKNIFHPFFTTKETGTGLGLALVHQMVVEHGGEITVESELGRGSVFRVTLPTVQPGQVELAETA